MGPRRPPPPQQRDLVLDDDPVASPASLASAAGAAAEDSWHRVGARSSFESPAAHRGSVATGGFITRPLTPTGTHLARSDPHWSGVAAMPPHGALKRGRDEEPAGAAAAKRGAWEGIKTDGAEADATSTPLQGERTTILRDRQMDALADDTGGLPAEKGFPIQIGSELFRLSGASIMSDAPSYFSRFFQDQLRNPAGDGDGGGVKTLYIDRDPITFQDIALHLQGYFVKPRDSFHYVRLFSDAQFYGLPKLIRQLFESDFCIRIGERNFVVPRDLFSSPGNSPNYFTLGFAGFLQNSSDVFPGLERENLFRPPSIDPPALLQRSADTFADLLHMLRGYPLAIRNPEHRTALLRDCRYYHLRGLEQTLLPCTPAYNLARRRPEITMRLEDIRQSGLSFVAGPASPPPPPLSSGAAGAAAAAAAATSPPMPLAVSSGGNPNNGGYVHYARPFVDDTPAELILELGPASARLDAAAARLTLVGSARARVTSLLHVVATKMNLPGTAPLGLRLQAHRGGAGAGVPSGAATNNGSTGASGGGSGGGGGGQDMAATEPAASVTSAAAAAAASLDPEDTTCPGPSTTPLADDDRVHVRVGAHAHVRLNGADWSGLQVGSDAEASALTLEPEWQLQRSQWRLRIRPRGVAAEARAGRHEVVLEAVKLEGVTGEEGRNAARGWVNGE